MIKTTNFFRVWLFFIYFMIDSIHLSTSDVSSNNTKGESTNFYEGFKQVQVLNTSNFVEEVFERQKYKLWIVEFYKHWCGDCIRFSPVFKSLAIDIFGWRDTVAVGALDCADLKNTKVCRDKKVGKVPALRIFHPESNRSSLGKDFGKEGSLNGTALKYFDIREKLAYTLKEYHKNHSEIHSYVNLKPLTHCHLESLWKNFPEKVKYLLLMFEDETSLLGSQLALDLSTTHEVKVLLVDPNNKDLYRLVGMEQGEKGFAVIDKDSAKQIDNKTSCVISEPVFFNKTADITREELNKVVRKFLRTQGVNISDLPKIPISFGNVTEEQIQEAKRREAELRKTLNVSDLTIVVFQIDLEAAVNYAFKEEISLMDYITGDPLRALKNFVGVLFKYFPSEKQTKRFFRELKEDILNRKNMVRGKDLIESFEKLKQKYSSFTPDPEWVGCRGTVPIFRGYPCTVWTLFHTLMALEELQNRNTPSQEPEALNAMAGYIEHFFSCKVCSEHFTEMATTIAGNVTTQKDAVIWLWKAHNNVNHRLASDATEDPLHPKVQFPPKDLCPSCYSSDGSWAEDQVFNFLSKKYTNPVHYDPHHLN